MTTRLQDDDVPLLKAYLARGYRVKDLARVFGVSRQTVSMIRNGRAHTHV